MYKSTSEITELKPLKVGHSASLKLCCEIKGFFTTNKAIFVYGFFATYFLCPVTFCK